jgi:hypothetical protein
MMFTSTTCRFALFFFLSLSANAEKGLKVLDESESTVDSSRGLAVGGADDAHRMLHHDDLDGPFLDPVPTAKWYDTEERFPIDYADLGTKILGPGKYDAAAALGLTGKLQLHAPPPSGGVQFFRDPEGVIVFQGPPVGGGRALVYDPSPPSWTIYVHGAFTTLAGSEVVFTGVHGPVHWVIDGAVTIGANTQMLGNITAGGAMTVGASTDAAKPSFEFTYGGPWNFEIGGALTFAALSNMKIDDYAVVNWKVTGAITFGAGSNAYGNMESTGGAITLGANARTVPNDMENRRLPLDSDRDPLFPLYRSGNLKASEAITLGASAVTGTLQAGAARTFGAAASVNGVTVAPYPFLQYADCLPVSVFTCPPL